MFEFRHGTVFSWFKSYALATLPMGSSSGHIKTWCSNHVVTSLSIYLIVSNVSSKTEKRKMEKQNISYHQVDLYYYVQIDSKVELFPIQLSLNGTTEQLEQAIAECDKEMENIHGRVVMKWGWNPKNDISRKRLSAYNVGHGSISVGHGR